MVFCKESVLALLNVIDQCGVFAEEGRCTVIKVRLKRFADDKLLFAKTARLKLMRSSAVTPNMTRH